MLFGFRVNLLAQQYLDTNVLEGSSSDLRWRLRSVELVG